MIFVAELGLNHGGNFDLIYVMIKESKLAGADNLAVGVESGSEAVRDHMKKQFSNQDLDEFMEQAYKHNINLEFLMIIGYPTETQTDFQDTIDMFTKYTKYQKIISSVALGSTLGVLPGTPLEVAPPLHRC